MCACIKLFQYFTIEEEVIRHYRRFNTEEGRLTMRKIAPPTTSTAEQDPAQYFADIVDELFEYSLPDLYPSDMVGIWIHNADNQQDKQIGLSFKRTDQISRDILWDVFDEVTQSNARFQALDTFTFMCILSRCLWALARIPRIRKE